ncbi:MAG: glycerate kinase, partial [Flavobacteriaceae bacterium]|nr:glycerate kinase [Flavobacteriaceae bacterium]
MNILLAPDSFKDSLTATEVCVSMRKGILKVNPDATIVSLPMADGGEGTLEALTVATKGKIIVSPTFDSLMRPIESRYAILGDGETAVIELAQASGMELLKPEERNPMLTNTYGTGILILEAFNRGCRKFIIC